MSIHSFADNTPAVHDRQVRPQNCSAAKLVWSIAWTSAPNTPRSQPVVFSVPGPTTTYAGGRAAGFIYSHGLNTPFTELSPGWVHTGIESGRWSIVRAPTMPFLWASSTSVRTAAV